MSCILRTVALRTLQIYEFQAKKEKRFLLTPQTQPPPSLRFQYVCYFMQNYLHAQARQDLKYTMLKVILCIALILHDLVFKRYIQEGPFRLQSGQV